MLRGRRGGVGELAAKKVEQTKVKETDARGRWAEEAGQQRRRTEEAGRQADM